MSDQPESIADIAAEMRASARDSFASKLVAEYEKTGRLDDGPAAQALKDDDAYIASLADRIEAAVKDELAVAHAVADDFRATLAKALDMVCYLQAMLRDKARGGKAAPAKFDEAAFDAAVAKPNGWSGVADPVAEIRRMRDSGVAQETPKLEQCGNAAAMREALEKFLDFSRRGLAFFTSYRYTAAENEEIEAAFDGAKAALAAPARNCDRAKDEAEDLFAERFGRPWTQAEDDLAAWLFSQSEGGAK